MNYFKNTNNEIFAYDDEQIAQGYVANLTAITVSEKDLILNPPKTQSELNEEFNQNIYYQIATLEKDLIRPLRELLSTKTSATNKTYAQTKVDDIEAKIQALRSTLK